MNNNIMKNTFCIFTEVETQVLEDKKCDYVSKSGSKYYYTNNGVYRLSDHWGRTANSKWRLLPLDNEVRKIRLGYANFSDFHKDNLYEKLYFIEVDFDNSLVFFNHKNNKKPDCLEQLRTSTETTKTIRKIRNLMQNHSWTKHFENENILRKVVFEIINSDKTVLEIKKMFS